MTADNTPIPAHLRNISGEGRTDVYSSQESSQLASLRVVLSPSDVANFIHFQSIRIIIAYLTPIPAGHSFGWDKEGTIVIEALWNFNFPEQDRHNLVLFLLRILNKDSIMDLEK